MRAVLLCVAASLACSSSRTTPQAGTGTDGPGGSFNVVGATFFALQVPDDRSAAEWYRALFGVDEINHIESDDGRYSIRILSGQGLTIELIRPDAVTRSSGPSLGLFKTGFFVDDIEAAFAWLRANEVETDERIVTDEALDARTFVFRDPNGNRLQVFEKCPGHCPG